MVTTLTTFHACIRSAIRDGSSALFWFERWLDGKAPKDVWPDPFIVGSGCLADMQSLRSRVPLFSSDPEDQKVWIPETNGIFWVKSFCRFLNDGGLRICLGINF